MHPKFSSPVAATSSDFLAEASETCRDDQGAADWHQTSSRAGGHNPLNSLDRHFLAVCGVYGMAGA